MMSSADLRESCRFEAKRWSDIHMLAVLVCACLPVYTPLWYFVTRIASEWMKS